MGQQRGSVPHAGLMHVLLRGHACAQRETMSSLTPGPVLGTHHALTDHVTMYIFFFAIAQEPHPSGQLEFPGHYGARGRVSGCFSSQTLTFNCTTG